jgi:uncharacterized protein (TIGR02271 family)
MTRPGEPGDETTRHEEELQIEARTVDAGSLRVHKTVSSQHVSESVPRRVESAEIDRIAPHDQDSGQIETLEDGSLSIPILEEQLVVTRRMVVRERVIVRKLVTTVQETIEADLRSEQVDVERVPGSADEE